MISVPGLERKVSDNPFHYTETQQDEKKLALKTMREIYPDVPALYAEWVYDLCKNTSDEDLKKIMHKVNTEPSRFKVEKM
jgi:uncharacterized Fe-S cluster-containing radical SAM superfamily protein